MQSMSWQIKQSLNYVLSGNMSQQPHYLYNVSGYKLMRSEFQGLYCVFNWDLLRMFLLCAVIGSNVCRANNGGCSSLCLLTPTGRSCACADDQILDTDNKTCKGGVCCALSGLKWRKWPVWDFWEVFSFKILFFFFFLASKPFLRASSSVPAWRICL